MEGAATVILLQHAQKGREPVDPPLTAAGVAQAQAVAAELAARSPRVLVTSPSLRASQTLAPLAERLAGHAVTRVDAAARERMEWAEGVWSDLPSFLDDWGECTDDRARLPRQGDSSLGAARRMRGLVLRLAAEVGPGGVAVVATHGGSPWICCVTSSATSRSAIVSSTGCRPAVSPPCSCKTGRSR